jgi:predicted aconitase with swiveling domain
MKPDQFPVRRAWGDKVSGTALVMREGFSPRYDLDRLTGVISRVGHSVEGESVAGRILVIPTVKGGVAGGWAFADMLHKGIAPRALVFGRLNPVMVQGAVLARLPIMEGLPQEALQRIRTGDLIEVDPAEGSVRIIAPPGGDATDEDERR